MAVQMEQEIIEELEKVYCHFEKKFSDVTAPRNTNFNMAASDRAAELTQAYATMKLRNAIRYR